MVQLDMLFCPWSGWCGRIMHIPCCQEHSIDKFHAFQKGTFPSRWLWWTRFWKRRRILYIYRDYQFESIMVTTAPKKLLWYCLSSLHNLKNGRNIWMDLYGWMQNNSLYLYTNNFCDKHQVHVVKTGKKSQGCFFLVLLTRITFKSISNSLWFLRQDIWFNCVSYNASLMASAAFWSFLFLGQICCYLVISWHQNKKICTLTFLCVVNAAATN